MTQDAASVSHSQALEILTFVVLGKLIKVNLLTLLEFCIPTVLLAGPALMADLSVSLASVCFLYCDCW